MSSRTVVEARSGRTAASSIGTAKGDPLDAISVRGGCVGIAIDRPEIRCSSDAVKLFGDVGQRTGIANPALLYVIGHELAHLYQRRVGEYGGRAEVIDLQSAPAAKLKILRDACDPVAVKRESDADAISLEVLARLLPQSPYRETVFSERGSLYRKCQLHWVTCWVPEATFLERQTGSPLMMKLPGLW